MSLADQQVACEAENPQLRVPDGPIASGEGIGTQGEPERTRKAVYNFMRLPYHTQLGILENVGLREPKIADCADADLFAECFRRARERGDMYKLLTEIAKHVPAQPSPAVQAPESCTFCGSTDPKVRNCGCGCMKMPENNVTPCRNAMFHNARVAPVVPVGETKRDAGEAILSWRHGVHDFTITTTSAYLCEKLDEIAAEAFAKFAALPATEKEN